MTDKEKIQELFEYLGIPYTHKKSNHKHLPHWETIDTIITIRPSKDANNKVVGYETSVSEFYFDADGAFVRVGIWEA